MNVEALWTVGFGAVTAGVSEFNGGVVVMETERLFGGDSAYAYLGRYSLAGSRISGNLQIIRHNPSLDFISIYGIQETAFEIAFTGDLTAPDRISGFLHRSSFPDVQLVLTRLAALP